MKRYGILSFPLLLAAAAWAQPTQPPPQAPPPAQQPPGQPGAPGQPPPMTGAPRRAIPLRLIPRPGIGALEAGPRGRWWTNPETAKELGLTADQQRKMDDIFQQHRVSLIDLNAMLEKQEVFLEPLVSADQPEESKILAQIDRVAQARAELEKANARMLLGIRRVMTADQWQKLKTLTPAPREQGGPEPGGRGGGIGRGGATPPPGRE
jgi:Spy/CpxP family protein refolding chaperone